MKVLIKIIKILLVAVIILMILLISQSLISSFTIERVSNHARSVVQLKNYCWAISEFKREYGVYPEFLNIFNKDSIWTLDSIKDQEMFIHSLTGRDDDGNKVMVSGNIRANTFLEVTRGEIDAETGRIIDSHGNTHFTFLIDGDGDGWINGQLEPIGSFEIPGGVHAFAKNPDEELSVYTWDFEGN